MPDWVKHAIWWQVYPLGFASAGAATRHLATARASRAPARAAEPVAGLRRRTSAPPGSRSGPVFASQTHGYDTTDHYRIDPRLGDERDFAELAGAAHARGLRVLLDGVFNHVGRGFPAFRRVLEQGPARRKRRGSG